jgi:glycogen synthase
MLPQPLSNLSIEQLKSLVISIVDERLSQHQVIQKTPEQQQLQEIFNSIDSHIWNPPDRKSVV